MNASDSTGYTPLHGLCQNYKKDELLMDIVHLMTENGADINVDGKLAALATTSFGIVPPPYDGKTPLEILCDRGFRV